MTRRLPVRWRLRLWYAALLACDLPLRGRSLPRASAAAPRRLRRATPDAGDGDARRGRGRGRRPAFEPGKATELDADLFLRLLDTESRNIRDSGDSHASVPVDDDVVASVLAGTAYSTGLDDAGETIRMISLPVRAEEADGAVVGVLQIGLDRDELDEPLAGFLHALALASPFTLLVSAVGGYLLAGRALAPVTTITDLAKRIGPRIRAPGSIWTCRMTSSAGWHGR